MKQKRKKPKFTKSEIREREIRRANNRVYKRDNIKKITLIIKSNKVITFDELQLIGHQVDENLPKNFKIHSWGPGDDWDDPEIRDMILKKYCWD